jgi:hypothetical protein
MWRAKVLVVGAAFVAQISLEGRDEMRAHDFEDEEAQAEGITLHDGWGIHHFTGEGRVQGADLMVCTCVFDPDGCFRPEYDDSQRMTLVCDNVEYGPAEMKRTGAEAVHLATSLVVGYPRCPRIDAFSEFVPARLFVEPVGVIHSGHHVPAQPPIQAVCAQGSPGRVVVFEQYAEGLDDIEGHSHLHLLYWLHRAAEVAGRSPAPIRSRWCHSSMTCPGACSPCGVRCGRTRWA